MVVVIASTFVGAECVSVCESVRESVCVWGGVNIYEAADVLGVLLKLKRHSPY
jgi:hypothetical protein